MRSDRGISTVVDISLALLLVTASLGVVGFFFLDEPKEQRPNTAEEASSMLLSTTGKIEYSIDDVQGDSAFPDSAIGDISSNDYTRDRFGSPMELLADAAVTNIAIDGSQLSAVGEPYADAVGGIIRDRLTGSLTNTYVVAIWRPYDRSSIKGVVREGVRPPGDADVSVVVRNVSSSFPTVEEGEAAAAYRESDEAGLADVLADAIVEGWLPPDRTQIAMEKDGLPADLAVYRYTKIQNILNSRLPDSYHIQYDVIGVGPDFPGEPTYLSGPWTNAKKANQIVSDSLAVYLEAQLTDTFDSMDSEPTPEEVGDMVSTGTVRVIVKTWSE